jgi:XTP/dITP diphosphohydrolase
VAGPRESAEATTIPSADESPLIELVAMMARLRAECGWKAAQTHRTLAKHLLEETYETIEAIEALDHGGSPDHLREELGDVLLQVYLHAAIAAQAGEFDIEDVARGLRDKMLRRNPHVFGDVVETDPARINDTWESVKAAEKQRQGLFDGIPLELPALSRAAKVLDRLERAGATLPPPDPDDVGDRLLAIVAEARAGGIDPEQALRDAVRRAGA